MDRVRKMTLMADEETVKAGLLASFKPFSSLNNTNIPTRKLAAEMLRYVNGNGGNSETFLTYANSFLHHPSVKKPATIHVNGNDVVLMQEGIPTLIVLKKMPEGQFMLGIEFGENGATAVALKIVEAADYTVIQFDLWGGNGTEGINWAEALQAMLNEELDRLTGLKRIKPGLYDERMVRDWISLSEGRIANLRNELEGWKDQRVE